MHFLLDVNLSVKLAWEFQRLGYKCEHVSVAIDKNAKDRMIADWANRTGAILVSKDADFADYCNSGLLRSQLVWLRCGNMNGTDTRALVRRSLPTVLLALKNGRKIVEIDDRPPTPQNPFR
jgi:predicted nuclease of predicted toxin-antitoxin system